MDNSLLIPEINIKKEPDNNEVCVEETLEAQNILQSTDYTHSEKEETCLLTEYSHYEYESVLKDKNTQMTKEEQEIASLVSIFEPEVKIESAENIDFRCGSSLSNEDDGEDGNSGLEFEEEDDPDDEDFVLKKYKIEEKEKNFECPLCGKFFLTSSAMNGHVAKVHGTTLGIKFTCHICGAPGSSRASLKRHLIRTHKLKDVDHPQLLTKKCSHCGIGFATHLHLYEHIRSEHKENVNDYFSCNWCPALMKAKASLQRHIRRAHPEEEQAFLLVEKCSFCEESFSSRVMLQRHLKATHPDACYACDVCNLNFKFPYLLSRHKLIHDDPIKYEEEKKKRKYSVTCEFCDRKFGSKPRLEYHIEMAHTNPPIKIYTCRACGLTFPTAKQNNRHYRKVHRPERQKIHCGKCNITFSTPEECTEHRALHPNTCEICQKQFLRRDSLREHLLIHSAPRHQCPHCTKKFTQRSNLKRHIRVHTGEKPYKCSYCNRRFSDKSACNSHTRVHTGYERSVCSICGASFSKKQRLNYHMRIHTGEGLLYCPLCMRPSTNSYSLRKHIESHQQPLTKALISIGFKPLLTSDPNFVIKALQAMTHATLQSMSRHQNIPNSFMEEVEESCVKGVAAASSLEKDVEECTEALTDMAKIGDDSELSPPFIKIDNDDDGDDDDDDDNTPFNLIKFLQTILERESQKIRINRQDGCRNKSICSNLEDHDLSCIESSTGSEYGDELPSTVGDELVRQCLEIIMEDEQSDENGENSDHHIQIKSENDTDLPIKIEEDFEYEEIYYEEENENIEVQKEEIDTKIRIKNEKEYFPEGTIVNKESKHKIDTSLQSLREIPKLKISRIAKPDQYSNEDLFVAEIIKKS